jgi:hypothetical protein
VNRVKEIVRACFLLSEIRRYRALKWPGSLLVGIVLGMAGYLSGYFPPYYCVGTAILISMITEAKADASLSIFRNEYSKYACDHCDSVSEALRQSPEPKGFLSFVKVLLSS